MQLSENQKKVIDNRLASYPGETWHQIVSRVVGKVVRVERASERSYWASKYMWAIENMYFLPNSPALRNFGANNGNGAACFVIPVEDSRRSIFQALEDAVEVQAFGGGTGFNFSALRPRDARIASTNGKSTGVVSFMSIFDHVIGDVIMQGGVRKGANMGILNVDHPEIVDFITAKRVEGKLKNFNISVGITDEFMKQVECGGSIALKHPAVMGGKPVNYIPAKHLWDMITYGAWKNGEPGVVFLDSINRNNPFEPIVATNPCGEQPLPPYTSCVLGSINLRKIGNDGPLMRDVINTAVRFLDSIIDVNSYPVKKIEEITKHYRNIGLGFMGLHDWLIKNNVRYGSVDGIESAKMLCGMFQEMAHDASRKLGNEYGFYPAYKGGAPRRRNANVTTIAPTGTLSMLADCSSGCEPYFAFEYDKHCMDETVTIKSSILEEAPSDHPLVTAQEIFPEEHVEMQIALQENIDAAISKTINLPNSATQSEVAELLEMAWRGGCKGLTVYRDGSRQIQAQEAVDRCPECGAKMVKVEGCCTCENPECGYSACSI